MKKFLFLIIVILLSSNTSFSQEKFDALSTSEKISLKPNDLAHLNLPVLDSINTIEKNITGYLIEKKSGNKWIYCAADKEKNGNTIDYILFLYSLKNNVYRITYFFPNSKKEISFFITSDKIAMK